MDICLDHLDLSTRSLAIKILRQDLKEVIVKMKGIPGQVDYDHKVAIDIYLADIEGQTAFLSDRAMARSIVQAVHRDDDINAAALAQERQADRDRQAALLLLNQDRLPDDAQRPEPDEDANIDDELRGSLEARYNFPTHDIYNDILSPEPLTLRIPLRPKTVPGRKCLICTESFSSDDLARLLCSHEYCRACLKKLLRRKDGLSAMRIGIGFPLVLATHHSISGALFR